MEQAENTITNNDDTRKGVVRWLIGGIFGLALIPLTVLLPAGNWTWLAGWGVFAIYAIWMVAQVIVILPRHPDLLAERSAGPRPDVPRWDTVVMGIVGVLELARNILAGLDYRFGWPGGFPQWVQIGGFVIALGGYLVLVWGMAANAYFSKVARVQSDRGQQVADTGPYRLVRHPGYLGTTVAMLAIPVMLDSTWALLVGGVMAALLVVRTALEDRMLRRELDGYEAYTQRTPYRLIPGVW